MRVRVRVRVTVTAPIPTCTAHVVITLTKIESIQQQFITDIRRADTCHMLMSMIVGCMDALLCNIYQLYLCRLLHMRQYLHPFGLMTEHTTRGGALCANATVLTFLHALRLDFHNFAINISFIYRLRSCCIATNTNVRPDPIAIKQHLYNPKFYLGRLEIAGFCA